MGPDHEPSADRRISRSDSVACIQPAQPAGSRSLEPLLGALLSLLATPLPRLEGALAAALWRQTGTGLPLLSSIEDLGALEPGLRRSGHARRRRRVVQPIALLPGIPLHRLPGRIPLRRDPRIQSHRLPADLFPDEGWGLCLDMRPRNRTSRRQRRRWRGARFGIDRYPRSGALRRLLRSTRHQGQGTPAVRGPEQYRR